MHILAMDTSNLPLSVAVITPERVLGELTLNVERNHSIKLMPAIRSLLADVRLSAQEIDLFVVARGPGSYTGVRIGVTTAKSMAWAVDKPLVGVSSLQVLAHAVPYFDGLIVPLFDARRERFYIGAYAWQDGGLIEVVAEQVLHRDELVRLLTARGDGVVFVGADVAAARAYLTEALGVRAHFVPMTHSLPRAAHVAQLGYARYVAGAREVLAFVPTYLQATEAEVNLRK